MVTYNDNKKVYYSSHPEEYETHRTINTVKYFTCTKKGNYSHECEDSNLRTVRYQGISGVF